VSGQRSQLPNGRVRSRVGCGSRAGRAASRWKGSAGLRRAWMSFRREAQAWRMRDGGSAGGLIPGRE